MTVHSTAPVNKRCVTYLRTYLSFTETFIIILKYIRYFFGYVIISYEFVINVPFTKKKLFRFFVHRFTFHIVTPPIQLLVSFHRTLTVTFCTPVTPLSLCKMHHNTSIWRHNIFPSAGSMSKPNGGCQLGLTKEVFIPLNTKHRLL